MKALYRNKTVKKDMNMGYWLTSDGNTYWGMALACGGKLEKPIRVSAKFHSLDLSKEAKAGMYRWENFWK